MASKASWVGAVSDYFSSLDRESAARYVQKMRRYGLESDPLLRVGTWSRDASTWPQVTYADVFNYLIHAKSPYTAQDLKAYKSLEAYKYLVAGFVQEVETKSIKQSSSCQVVRAKVCNMQS